MSEPTFTAEQRDALQGIADTPSTVGPFPALRAALARLDWLEAQLAALAPLADLRCELREGHAAAVEMGAALERVACAAQLEEGASNVDSPIAFAMREEARIIRARGPCLAPPPT